MHGGSPTLRALLGPLELHFSDPAISEIIVAGPDKVFATTLASTRPLSWSIDEARIRALADRLVRALGPPLEPARWRGPISAGFEAVVLGAPRGPRLPLIRVARRVVPSASLDALSASGFVDPATATLLREACADACTIVVAGRARTGKTALIAALAREWKASGCVAIADAANGVLEAADVGHVRLDPEQGARDAIALGAAVIVADAPSPKLFAELVSLGRPFLVSIEAQDASTALSRMIARALAGAESQSSRDAAELFVESSVDLIVETAREGDRIRARALLETSKEKGVLGVRPVLSRRKPAEAPAGASPGATMELGRPAPSAELPAAAGAPGKNGKPPASERGASHKSGMMPAIAVEKSGTHKLSSQKSAPASADHPPRRESAPRPSARAPRRATPISVSHASLTNPALTHPPVRTPSRSRYERDEQTPSIPLPALPLIASVAEEEHGDDPDLTPSCQPLPVLPSERAPRVLAAKKDLSSLVAIPAESLPVVPVESSGPLSFEVSEVSEIRAEQLVSKSFVMNLSDLPEAPGANSDVVLLDVPDDPNESTHESPQLSELEQLESFGTLGGSEAWSDDSDDSLVSPIAGDPGAEPNHGFTLGSVSEVHGSELLASEDSGAVALLLAPAEKDPAERAPQTITPLVPDLTEETLDPDDSRVRTQAQVEAEIRNALEVRQVRREAAERAPTALSTPPSPSGEVPVLREPSSVPGRRDSWAHAEYQRISKSAPRAGLVVDGESGDLEVIGPHLGAADPAHSIISPGELLTSSAAGLASDSALKPSDLDSTQSAQIGEMVSGFNLRTQDPAESDFSNAATMHPDADEPPIVTSLQLAQDPTRDLTPRKPEPVTKPSDGREFDEVTPYSPLLEREKKRAQPSDPAMVADGGDASGIDPGRAAIVSGEEFDAMLDEIRDVTNASSFDNDENTEAALGGGKRLPPKAAAAGASPGATPAGSTNAGSTSANPPQGSPAATPTGSRSAADAKRRPRLR